MRLVRGVGLWAEKSAKSQRKSNPNAIFIGHIVSLSGTVIDLGSSPQVPKLAATTSRLLRVGRAP